MKLLWGFVSLAFVVGCEEGKKILDQGEEERVVEEPAQVPAPRQPQAPCQEEEEREEGQGEGGRAEKFTVRRS